MSSSAAVVSNFVSSLVPNLNPAMDGEHRVQVGLINALCDAVESEKSANEVGRILEQLVDYCKVHFMSEELLMRLDSYDGFEEHVEDHAQMIEALEAIAKNQGAGNAKLIPGQARSLLGFLLRHIETRDASYAANPKAR